MTGQEWMIVFLFGCFFVEGGMAGFLFARWLDDRRLQNAG